MEGENPTRRYKSFRPRQAQRSVGAISPTNFGAVALFNNSTGSHVLVVRAVRLYGETGSVFANDFNLNRALSTAFLQPVPVVSSSPVLAGVVKVEDLASFPDPYAYNFDSPADIDTWWEQPFPIAVVEPGWSYGVFSQTAGQYLQVSFVWEAITIDELDFLY